MVGIKICTLAVTSAEMHCYLGKVLQAEERANESGRTGETSRRLDTPSGLIIYDHRYSGP